MLKKNSRIVSLLGVAVFVGAAGAGPAMAMEVMELDGRVIVTGANFRYVWDTRRGGELASVEQRGTSQGGWWNRGGPRPLVTPAMSGESVEKAASWYRVNSTLAWKSVDTIPALSFSTKRGAYYSGEWNVATCNADRKSTIKIIKWGSGKDAGGAAPATGTKKQTDEIVIESTSNPKIFENQELPVPWKVKQTYHVFDSGLVVLDVEAELPKDEVYELDWAQMGFNLDDTLYKEPHGDRQALFQYEYGFPGEKLPDPQTKRPVIQEFEHMPLDIDVPAGLRITTDNKPILFGAVAYDTTHMKGSPWNGFSECSLEEAKSIVGTVEDFGSMIMKRPRAGMSPPPPYAGSHRFEPNFGLMWNLFDGKVRGLNEPFTYRNRMAFAFAQRKRSNSPTATGDDRNVLLGARVYYAKNALPGAADITTMASEGCDTIILGSAWQKDANATAAIVQAAHGAGLRVGVVIDAKNSKTLLTDTTWFSKVFQKDRDGLLVTNANFLTTNMSAAEFDAAGDKVSFKKLETNSTNAVNFALCMRGFRNLVGPGGFLIAQEDSPEARLLGTAECDLFCSASPDSYRGGSAADRCLKRYHAAAGFAPVLDSLSPQWMGVAAMHGDTPIIVWPAKDKKHADWWKMCQKIPQGRSELSLFAAEKRFECTPAGAEGMLTQAADGKGLLLVTSQNGGEASVSFSASVQSAKAIDGSATKFLGSSLDAGDFKPWQVKAYELVIRPENSR